MTLMKALSGFLFKGNQNIVSKYWNYLGSLEEFKFETELNICA